MKTLYTAGYGNRKPDEFIKLLKDAGITVVLDVRREGSKSWCGKYHQGNAMKKLMKGAGFVFASWDVFGNKYDTLDAYRKWLAGAGHKYCIEYSSRKQVREGGDSICLICAEKYAYNHPHPGRLMAVVNCHRKYIADALVNELGDGWEAVHL